MWNAPRRQRIMGGLMHVRNRAPFLGGSFAMWGGVFSSIDCLLIYYRQKDDPWNAVAAGFFTGGILAIRGGLSVAFKNAFIGGVILLLIEGVSTIVTSVAMRHQYMAQQAEMEKLKNMTEKQRMEYMQNMWNTEYNQQESNANKEGETMLDKAKSFSY
jgi:mitochondrial import inner membrane translocase subunit TIM17